MEGAGQGEPIKRMLSSHRNIWQSLLAVFFVMAGANHFLNPEPYLRMMPSYLPWHSQLVWISGVAEVIGGLGVLFERTRKAAGGFLIALLIAVFPANLNVAIHGWPGSNLPQWSLWARLPLQIILIWGVTKVCFRSNAPRESDQKPA